MTKIRAELSKKNPLYIDKHAFYMVYHFVLQYPEWKTEYSYLISSSVKGIDYDDMPHGNNVGDPTAMTAIKTSALKSKIELIEHTAMIAGRESWQHLLYGVTNEVTYEYLRHGRNEKLGRIPCGRNQYYQMRRLFYYLVYQRMEVVDVTG